MSRWTAPVLAAVAALAMTESSQAQLDIRVPFVRVQIGNGVRVQAPFVEIFVPPGRRMLPPPVVAPPPGFIPAPAPVLPPVVEPPAPRPVDPVPAPEIVGQNKAMTHQDFASSFKAAAGNYEVELMHPGTNRPVRVTFTLPAGQPKVTVLRRAIEFDYGRQQVEIRFLANGRVQVENHN